MHTTAALRLRVNVCLGCFALLSSCLIGCAGEQHPLTGQEAPLVRMPLLKGGTFDLRTHRGKEIVILDFWATWCGPCRRELPEMQRLANLYPERLAILAVNLQESSGAAASFWEELELDLPILLDSNGDVADRYRLGNRLPSHFFIDEEGVLRALRIGIITEDEMRQQLEELGLTTAAELLNAD